MLIIKLILKKIKLNYKHGNLLWRKILPNLLVVMYLTLLDKDMEEHVLKRMLIYVLMIQFMPTISCNTVRLMLPPMRLHIIHLPGQLVNFTLIQNS